MMQSIFLLSLMLFTNCLAVVDRNAGIKYILLKVLTDKNTSQYLGHYKNGIELWCEKSPVYEGVKLVKPTFAILYKQNQLIKPASSAEENKQKTLIVFESISVSKNQAIVVFRIPKEGAHGKYILQKLSNWVVTDNEMVEF